VKNEKYNTVGTVPKSSRKIIDRGKTDTSSMPRHCLKSANVK
jgi:hypothetical protein